MSRWFKRVVVRWAAAITATPVCDQSCPRCCGDQDADHEAVEVGSRKWTETEREVIERLTAKATKIDVSRFKPL